MHLISKLIDIYSSREPETPSSATQLSGKNYAKRTQHGQIIHQENESKPQFKDSQLFTIHIQIINAHFTNCTSNQKNFINQSEEPHLPEQLNPRNCRKSARTRFRKFYQKNTQLKATPELSTQPSQNNYQ